MAWRNDTLGTLPPAAWPVEMVVYVAAMSPGDIAQVITLVIAGTGGSAALIGRFLWAKWEQSNAKKLKDALEDHAAVVAKLREDLADCKMECDEARAERDAERVDRARVRQQKDAELDRRQEIIDGLRKELESAYKTVAAKDGT